MTRASSREFIATRDFTAIETKFVRQAHTLVLLSTTWGASIADMIFVCELEDAARRRCRELRSTRVPFTESEPAGKLTP